MTSNVLFLSFVPRETDFSSLLPILYAVLPVLLRPSAAVMATKSRHVSEVMATVQISVVAEKKIGDKAPQLILFLIFYWIRRYRYFQIVGRS